MMRYLAMLCAMSLVATAAQADTPNRVRQRTRLRAPSPSAAFVFQPSPPSLASGTAATRGGAITVTRASSPLCCQADGSCATVAANTLCVTSSGAEVYGAGGNGLLYSETLDGGTWTGFQMDAPSTCETRRGVRLCRIHSTTAAGTRYQVFGVTSSAGPFTTSGFLAADSGTSTQTIQGGCQGGPTVSACACAREDGGACTASASGAVCNAYTDVPTQPVRVWATWTCSGAVTSVTAAVHDGQIGSTGGVYGWAGGMQHVSGQSPGQYYVTTSGTVTAPATVTQPAVEPITDPSSWSVTLSAKPAAGWGAASVGLWQWGTAGAGNSVSIYALLGVLKVDVYDATGAVKTWSGGSLSAVVEREVRINYASGSVIATADGAALTLATSGAGTGILGAAPAAETFGLGGSYYLNGALRVLKVAKR